MVTPNNYYYMSPTTPMRNRSRRRIVTEDNAFRSSVVPDSSYYAPIVTTNAMDVSFVSSLTQSRRRLGRSEIDVLQASRHSNRRPTTKEDMIIRSDKKRTNFRPCIVTTPNNSMDKSVVSALTLSRRLTGEDEEIIRSSRRSGNLPTSFDTRSIDKSCVSSVTLSKRIAEEDEIVRSATRNSVPACVVTNTNLDKSFVSKLTLSKRIAEEKEEKDQVVRSSRKSNLPASLETNDNTSMTSSSSAINTTSLLSPSAIARSKGRNQVKWRASDGRWIDDHVPFSPLTTQGCSTQNGSTTRMMTATTTINDYEDDDRDVYQKWLKKIMEDPWNLMIAPDIVKNHKDIVLAAVQKRGKLLRFASKRLQDDRDVVMMACRHCGFSLKYASNRLQDDEAIVLEAVQKDGTYPLILYASDRIKCINN